MKADGGFAAVSYAQWLHLVVVVILNPPVFRSVSEVLSKECEDATCLGSFIENSIMC